MHVAFLLTDILEYLLMGLDPNDDNFDTQIVCPACVDILFGGFTPVKVCATFKDIILCPDKFPPTSEPNRTFILTQNQACQWQVFEAGYQVVWDLAGGNSWLFIRSGAPFWFSGHDANPCIDEFVNERDCVHPGTWSSTGTGKVFWGPQIGKEPIS